MIETVSFAGKPISRLIKGGWQLHERSAALDRDAALQDMHRFVDAGISVFEVSDTYRGVEALVGAFRAQRPVRVHARLSVPPDAHPTRDSVSTAIDAIRSRLRQDRLDLLQLSMWRFDRHPWTAAAREIMAMPERVAQLGIMNVDAEDLERLSGSGVTVASAQAQFSLIDRRAERSLLPACREAGIAFFGYGALAGGLLSRRWLGRPDPGLAGAPHPEYRAIVEAFGGWPLLQRLLMVLDAIATSHGVGIGTIALRWALDRADVSALLVGARDSTHLPELQRLATVSLSEPDNAALAAVLADSKGPGGPVGGLERDPSSALARAIAARR